jgi:hypothetical protein
VEVVLKTIVLLFAAILAVGCTHSGKPETSTSAPTPATKDEARLAEALSGRIAGAPQGCIDSRHLEGTTYIGGVILFRDRVNDVIWLTRTTGGCSGLGLGRALKFEGPQLCRESVVTVVDPATGREDGACGLGEFTPYRLAR